MNKDIEEQIEVIAWALGKRKPMLSISDVSLILGVSVSTVSNWVALGIFLDYMKPYEQIRHKTGHENNNQKEVKCKSPVLSNEQEEAKSKGRILFPITVIARFVTYGCIKAA